MGQTNEPNVSTFGAVQSASRRKERETHRPVRFRAVLLKRALETRRDDAQFLARCAPLGCGLDLRLEEPHATPV